ncbi:MAG: manganese efflux pump, partial [Limnobacter sp.]|nr:manganese efflux pump [Limnobacter sp.]
MFEVFALALGLAMDAFAVSLTLGAMLGVFRLGLALQAALYFAVFQGGMAWLGILGEQTLLSSFQQHTRWLAFALLLGIGVKMIFDSFSNEDEAQLSFTHRMLLG